MKASQIEEDYDNDVESFGSTSDESSESPRPSRRDSKDIQIKKNDQDIHDPAIERRRGQEKARKRSKGVGFEEDVISRLFSMENKFDSFTHRVDHMLEEIWTGVQCGKSPPVRKSSNCMPPGARKGSFLGAPFAPPLPNLGPSATASSLPGISSKFSIFNHKTSEEKKEEQDRENHIKRMMGDHKEKRLTTRSPFKKATPESGGSKRGSLLSAQFFGDRRGSRGSGASYSSRSPLEETHLPSLDSVCASTTSADMMTAVVPAAAVSDSDLSAACLDSRGTGGCSQNSQKFSKQVSATSSLTDPKRGSLPKKISFTVPETNDTPAEMQEEMSSDVVSEVAKTNDFRGKRDKRMSNLSGHLNPQEMVQAIRVAGMNRNQKCEDLWRLLSDPESSVSAQMISRVMKIVILASVVTPFFQTEELVAVDDAIAIFLEVSFDLIFAFEIILRFVVCPSRCVFCQSLINWLDFTVLMSLILRLCAAADVVGFEKDSATWQILLCVVPLLRILKMCRHFQTLQILFGAFILAAEALPVLLYMLLVITLASSCLIYIVEPRDNIPTLAKAVWLTIVTMTTVGYGDVTPVSTTGYFLVSILLVISVLFMAMPIGIIGSAFNMTWSDRDRILLTQRTRDRLLQWGCTAEDVMVLFKFMDSDGDGALSLEDFIRFMQHMRMGLTKDRVAQLFYTFDNDGSGTVEAEEFIRAFFPTSFLEIFQEMQREEDFKFKRLADQQSEGFVKKGNGLSRQGSGTTVQQSVGSTPVVGESVPPPSPLSSATLPNALPARLELAS